jgi:hypothetical protein
MKLLLITLPILWVVAGIIKVRFFDRNKETDWLMMLSDKRNRRCGVVWFYVMLLVAWLSWPVAIFSKRINLSGSFFRFQWRFWP